MIRFLRLALPLLLLAAAGLYLWLQSGALDRLVAAEVERLGSAAAGTPVTLQRARVDLAQGSVRLEGLAVANPDGYRSASALTVDRIDATLDTTLLDPRQLWLREVGIEGALATFEQAETGSNLQRLLERLASRPAGDGSAAAGDDRQLVIDRLTLDGATVRILAEDSADPRMMPIPGLELVDIGIAEGGASAPDAAALVLRAILARALLAGAEPALRGLIDSNTPDSARELRESAGQGAQRLRELLDDAGAR